MLAPACLRRRTLRAGRSRRLAAASGSGQRRFRLGVSRRHAAEDPADRDRRARRRRRDRRQHVRRSRADRRDLDRQRHEDRQSVPDRAQLPHRAAYRDRGTDGSRRHDDDRRLRANRRSERFRRTSHGRFARENRRRRRGLGRRRCRRDRKRLAGARAPRKLAGTGVRCGAFRNSTNASKRSNARAHSTIPASIESCRIKQRSATRSNFRASACIPAAPASVRVLPAPAGSGLRFRLDGAVEFPAHPDYVVDTRRATVLGLGEHRVSTVEHLLSALSGTGITNALIAVDGPEIPASDGSALEFTAAIDAAGIVEQPLAARAQRRARAARVSRRRRRCSPCLPAPRFACA